MARDEAGARHADDLEGEEDRRLERHVAKVIEEVAVDEAGAGRDLGEPRLGARPSDAPRSPAVEERRVKRVREGATCPLDVRPRAKLHRALRRAREGRAPVRVADARDVRLVPHHAEERDAFRPLDETRDPRYVLDGAERAPTHAEVKRGTERTVREIHLDEERDVRRRRARRFGEPRDMRLVIDDHRRARARRVRLREQPRVGPARRRVSEQEVALAPLGQVRRLGRVVRHEPAHRVAAAHRDVRHELGATERLRRNAERLAVGLHGREQAIDVAIDGVQVDDCRGQARVSERALVTFVERVHGRPSYAEC